MTEIRYNYDAMNYLVEARFANGQILRYEYDPRGNRTAVIVTPASPAYDAAGNQSSVIVKEEATPVPAPAPNIPKQGNPQKPATPPTEVMHPAPAVTLSSSDATLIESRPTPVEIMVLNGELENQRFPISDKMRLGREADNDLVLPDKKASRHHAILQKMGLVYQIIDLNSGNGTYVNEKRITDPTLLKNGDIVLIGDTKLTISDQR